MPRELRKQPPTPKSRLVGIRLGFPCPSSQRSRPPGAHANTSRVSFGIQCPLAPPHATWPALGSTPSTPASDSVQARWAISAAAGCRGNLLHQFEHIRDQSRPRSANVRARVRNLRAAILAMGSAMPLRDTLGRSNERVESLEGHAISAPCLFHDPVLWSAAVWTRQRLQLWTRPRLALPRGKRRPR
jgi:hypothetical protein